MGRKGNGDGSTRQLADGSWECLVQSKYPNPKTGNPKRIKRKAATEKEAIEKAGMTVLEVTHQGEWVSITARK